MSLYSSQNEQKNETNKELMRADDLNRVIKENFSGNQELFLKYSSIFLNNLNGYLDELSQRIESDRYEDAAKILHRIRGTVAIFGFSATCELMKEFEKALLINSEDQLDLLYDQTVESLLNLEGSLKKYQAYVKEEED